MSNSSGPTRLGVDLHDPSALAGVDVWDVVIVGSGYGGSIAAAGLSDGTVTEGGPLALQRPAKILLLERGREYLPGEFPASFSELPGHVRMCAQDTGAVTGTAQGLFDLRPGKDVATLVANGLGGGSLINAGVMLEPRGVTGPLQTLVTALQQGGFYERASRALGGEVDDGSGTFVKNTIGRHDPPMPCKTKSLESLATGQRHELVPISVAMTDGPNSAGIHMPACVLCGDCMTGCNVGAKNSLDANLLALAQGGGIRIVTAASVTRLRRVRQRIPLPEGGWVLEVEHSDPRQQAREANRPREVLARRVILAAGSLGSTEILLRSRSDLLAFSPRLGERFSCNGDNLGAARGLAVRTNSCAHEDDPLVSRHVGPTITASIDMPAGAKQRPFRVQEFAVPGPLQRLFDELVTTSQSLHDVARADTDSHGDEQPDAIDVRAVDPVAMDHTLLLGTIGHDAAAGVLELPMPLRTEGDIDAAKQPRGVRIRWPEARYAPELQAAHDALDAQVKDPKRGTSLLPNPLWRLLPDKLEELVTQPRGPVLTVHPLGGCAIAADAADGVVDEFGRVFRTRVIDSDDWFGTLVVLDGSIVPGSLGANPALTISAIALRAIEQLRADWRIHAPLNLGAMPPPLSRLRAMAPPRRPHMVIGPKPDTEVELVERLYGPATLDLGGPHSTPCIVELTMAFRPLRVQSLMSTWKRVLDVDPAISRVRLYEAATWEKQHLRLCSDGERRHQALAEGMLSGTLRIFHREPSGALRRRLRVLLPWLRNRGGREIWQFFRERWLALWRGRGASPSSGPSLSERAQQLWDFASRAGECRRFDYELSMSNLQPLSPALGVPWPSRLSIEQPVRGHKRLTYECRANPWHQLTRMALTEFPGLRRGDEPVLTLDARFLAGQGVPLMRITGQRDQANALADVLSLVLYVARVIVGIHLWTFRAPDAALEREPVRLPGPIPGVPDPEITELVTSRREPGGEPVKVRLTRYAQPGSKGQQPTKPPLVMIHGYSVSGNTFTHPSLRPSAAEYFWKLGREVWVVDLRSSSGMPTATLPWAFEEAGLIDIPAALLHIRQVSGQPVDVLAHCIGCAMLSMALLTDAHEIRQGTVELGVDTWLTREHLGTLAAFNGRRAPGAQHPCVRSVVLSQKGPVLIYTDGNVFRAYLLQMVRRWLLPDSFQFRPLEQATVGSQLVDRLLASLPYPDEDYDVDNPRLPWKTAPWARTRHRMDALYGRDFNAANLRPATLRSIDDLFGGLNLDTVAQTIHFARFDTITNQRGRGEFVTLGRLRQRWRGIPTLLLHGADNGLVDVATQRLLEINFRRAGVDVLAPDPEPGVGHQDLLIGRQAEKVFDRIEAFLANPPTLTAANGPMPPVMPVTPIPGFELQLPWLGPRIVAPFETPFTAPPAVRIASMGRPDRGRSRLILLPVRVAPPNSRHAYELMNSPHLFAVSKEEPSDHWCFAMLPLPGDADDEMAGWLALHVYEAAESVATLHPPPTLPPHSLDQAESPLARFPLVLALVLAWLPEQTADALELAFLVRADIDRAGSLPQRVSPDLRVAVASCQYPSGLLDPVCAGRSLDLLAKHAAEIDMVLFLGDQIYADATAGLLDPKREDELYDQPHHAAFRQDGMRRVLRKLPAMMLLDDHELLDNWEPLADPQAAVSRGVKPCRSWKRLLPNIDLPLRRRSALAEAMQEARRHGGRAYWRYQRMRPVPSPRTPTPVADAKLTCAGVPIYFADTRMGRSMRGPFGLAWPRVLGPRQRRALADWLLLNCDAPKIVATPSRLLPRLAEPRRRRDGDAWDAYPASTRWLLRFILRHRIQNTVFVSGDEHHSFVAEAWLSKPNAPDESAVKIICVHSSALYAPFDFANGQARDLADEHYADPRIVFDVQTRFAPGDGWARLAFEGEWGQYQLRVQFYKAATGDVALEMTLPLT